MPADPRLVVVTGMGMLTALGNDVATTWAGLVAGRSGVRTIEAFDPSRLTSRIAAEAPGAILGTGLGGVGTLTEGITTNALRGPDRISPFLVPMGIPNTGSGQVAISFGMTGPNYTAVSACATGGHALGEASEVIRRGDADMMIAG